MRAAAGPFAHRLAGPAGAGPILRCATCLCICQPHHIHQSIVKQTATPTQPLFAARHGAPPEDCVRQPRGHVFALQVRHQACGLARTGEWGVGARSRSRRHPPSSLPGRTARISACALARSMVLEMLGWARCAQNAHNQRSGEQSPSAQNAASTVAAPLACPCRPAPVRRTLVAPPRAFLGNAFKDLMRVFTPTANDVPAHGACAHRWPPATTPTWHCCALPRAWG